MVRRQTKKNEPLIDIAAIVRYVALYIVFSIVVFGVDKVVLGAIEVSPTKQVGNSMLSLYEVHNAGAAFNLFSNQPEMIIILSFLAAAVLVFCVLIFSAKLTQAAISAMALLSAGITMNMMARVEHGYVIDYININALQNFPVFNTADIMIVFGALGLIISLFSKD